MASSANAVTSWSEIGRVRLAEELADRLGLLGMDQLILVQATHHIKDTALADEFLFGDACCISAVISDSLGKDQGDPHQLSR